MKSIFWIIVFVSISLSSVHGDEGEVTTFFQYKKDSPIILRLNYHGGITEWDAGASITNGTLLLSNAMFISVTNSKNESVEPKKGKVLSVWADTYFRSPFSLVLDISKFYNLSRPGKYTVQWGCKDIKYDSIYIEIVDE